MTRLIRHGTHGAYDKHHCRCDDCRAFSQQYRRELRRRHRDGECADYVDEVAVERACRSGRTGRLSRAEMTAAFAYLNSRGYSSRAIAQRLKVTARTVVRWRTGTVWQPPARARNTLLTASRGNPELPFERSA